MNSVEPSGISRAFNRDFSWRLQGLCSTSKHAEFAIQVLWMVVIHTRWAQAGGRT